jgi:phosphodiesterase/alkaline phosphatase D-like protein
MPAVLGNVDLTSYHMHDHQMDIRNVMQCHSKQALPTLAGGQPTPVQGPCVGFVHGVASGDPLPDSVIIWTRFTPQSNQGGDVQIQWFMDTSRSINTTAAA